MTTVHVDAGAPYDVLIGAGLLNEIGKKIRAIHAPCRAAIVTDETVGALYGARVKNALKGAGFEPAYYAFPAGEAQKTLETYGRVLRFLVQSGTTRGDLIVALGGGVVGDLAGFAAATYLRGIPFVQVPTTLLCAVDASVGGKTAVDLPEGKNLVGAFHQPALVLCDTDTFLSLPQTRMADGAAESVKHGLIADESLFERMRTGAWREQIEETVARNVEIKRSFVVGDERDLGKRQLLNFGHTIGHAVETLSGFSLSHGQAVAIGIACETRAGNRMGLGDADINAAVAALEANGLPTVCAFPAEKVLEIALRDKKRLGDRISVGVLERFGRGALKSLSLAEFERYVRLGVEA